MEVERYMHIFPNDSAYRYHREYEYNEPFVSFTTETDEPTDVNFNKRNGEANNKHLLVWLPLTGILDNWGNSDITVTNNGATSNTSGKTGDCYYFDGNAHYLQFSDSLTNLYCGDFTWALWLKPTDDTRSILISEYSSAGASNVALELYNSRKVRIYWNGNPNYYPNYNIPKDTWTHLCITKTNNLLKTYINGVLLEEKSVTLPDRTSTSKIRIGDDYRGGNSVSYMGYLNDIRIYDCCLSAEEVKELSKGLILHYKLNDKNIEPTRNLFNSQYCFNNCYNQATNKYGFGETTDIYREYGMFNGKFSTKVYMGTDGNAAYPYVYINFPYLNIYVSNGTNSPEYKTISFDYYGTIGTVISPYKLGSGSATISWTNNMTSTSAGTGTNSVNIPVVPKRWNHIAMTLHGTTEADAQWGYIRLGSGNHTSDTSNYWLFANMQIELKDHATPYVGVGISTGQLYDPNVYIEPDGSKWVRIVHHNNPASGVFSSGDTFSSDSGVYKDANRWFDAYTILNKLSTYELMVKQKTTSAETETKYRWIQNKNPFIATYADVAPAAVTRITTAGYTDGTFGGLFKNSKNTTNNNKAFFTIANNANTNWYGAFGSWTPYEGGTPGYPNTVVKSGYMDLYVRVSDNEIITIKDDSGYRNDGTIGGKLTVGLPSPKYNRSTSFSASNNTYIAVGQKPKVRDTITVACWAYMDNWSTFNARLLSCTETGGWTFYPYNSKMCFLMGVGTTSNTYLYAAGPTLSTITSGWHHFVGTYDGQVNKIYFDGQFSASAGTSTKTPIFYNANNGIFVGAEAVSDAITPHADNKFTGKLSDVRIYATALSAQDVLDLYNS